MDETAGPLRPHNLRTETAKSPLGLDEPTPLLAWELTGNGRSRAQRAYRIRLFPAAAGAEPLADGADAHPAVVWDSGEVTSDQSAGVTYAGPVLAARERYAWAVRVTDEAGRDSGWSEPAEFEMGLPAEADWQADGVQTRWIGAPGEDDLADAVSLDYAGRPHRIQRVWLPGALSSAARTAYFRTRFEVPAGFDAERVRLLADADEARVRVYCNGREVAADGSPIEANTIRSGTNVLAVAVEGNTEGRAGAGSDTSLVGLPGLVVRLDAESGGNHVVVTSDDSWRCSQTAGDGWETDGQDDSRWQLAQAFGLHGVAPHGRSPLSYRPSPCLRKEFRTDAPVRRARLYATALGLYEARLNGERVGDHRFAPGWTDYARRVPYQTYDVTDLVRSGDNVLAGVLADGWYAGNVCWFGPFQYGRHRLFRARLEVEHTDGTRTVVATDESWRAGEGATRYADLQNGEVVDARLEPTGWDLPGFDDSAWQHAVAGSPTHGPLEAEVAPPIRVKEILPAVTVTSPRSGVHLVDFGQNLVGWVRLRVRGQAGTRLLLRHAEVLDHRGELYVEALRDARATDEYVLRGDPDGEVFEPRFTVHGFRYAEIVGLQGDLDPADVQAKVVFADMEQIGTFECSDPRLNQLQHNIVWGQRGNFLSVPTDCPQRDERLGWTGDAQVFASTAAYNYDVRSFLRKWLRDLRDGQQPDGGVPHVAPDVLSPQSFQMGGDGRAAAGAAGWGDAIEIVPWELLRAYGDRRVVAENLAAVGSWLDYLESHSTDLVRPAEGFADWLAPTPTPADLVATAFFAYAARVAAKLAAELDRSDDAARWEKLYEQVRAAFRARYVRGGGRVESGTQTSYVLALHFGLLEPAEEPLAARHLVEEIASRNWHLATGFLGTPYLLPVLSRFGFEDVAFRLLTQDTFPSWLYPVVHGDATTMWERWDSWSDSRGFQDPGMTSFNHYAYGAVGEWIYQTLGGIAPGEPGYRKVVVRPRAGGDVSWARASLRTPYGKVSTRWRQTPEGAFTLEVTLPPNVTGEVWLPTADASGVTEGGEPLAAADGLAAEPSTDGRETLVRVGSGSYTFQVPAMT
ncbi:family 78 glycoside hydrolase catalytic domain [Actinopolymorpha singaporensis]|uniref:alpha-L-rhamnosidase n=1 Tax=Actinopolymorpha singaporensis TaxID=117157 RepID=A0A1H1LEP0_9ACTN|nr:family 78 glycoside hydrolase catalytic domain [Actinopolymorpha singaporensis]SDR72877.1 alpha-L-rhamnosidase [Actinopolymorpha singaporensis]